MKKLALLAVVVVLVLSMVGQAAALSAPDSIDFGDDKQRASNPLADDEDYHDTYLTTTVTLLNDGTSALSNLALGTVSPLIGFSAEDLDITATFPVDTLAVDDSTEVTLSIRVPEDLDAVDSDYLKAAFHVANVQFTATDDQTNAVTVTSEVTLERENQLFFDSILICVNEDCERLDSGDTVSDLKPGDKIEMTFAVENKYRDNDREDLSIEDVVLEWVVDKDELDEEDESDFGDLGPQDVEEDSFSFVIDDEVTDGSYDLNVFVYGEDENGAMHGDSATIELKVKRERHGLDIRDVEVSPSSLNCDSLSRFVTFSIETANIGKSDEDEVVLNIQSSKLGIDTSSEEMEVEESESKTTNLRVEIPDDAEAGVYVFKVSSFYDRTVLSDEEEVTFIVPKCEEPEPVVVTPVETVEPEPEPVAPVVDKRVSSNLVDEFTQSNAYIALLVVGIVLAMLILVFLVVRVVPPRKE